VADVHGCQAMEEDSWTMVAVVQMDQLQMAAVQQK